MAPEIINNLNEDLSQKYGCSGCRNLLLQDLESLDDNHPMQTTCGHRFCHGCYCNFVNDQGLGAINCPVNEPWIDMNCNTVDLRNQNSWSKDAGIVKDMKRLQVKCPYDGCPFSTAWKYMSEHQQQCPCKD